MIAKKVIFTGRVQGVGFRYATKQLALGFEVVGTVKNLSDGTVELRVQGEAEEVEEFITEISQESDLVGFIKEVAISTIPEIDDRGFSIAH